MLDVSILEENCRCIRVGTKRRRDWSSNSAVWGQIPERKPSERQNKVTTPMSSMRTQVKLSTDIKSKLKEYNIEATEPKTLEVSLISWKMLQLRAIVAKDLLSSTQIVECTKSGRKHWLNQAKTYTPNQATNMDQIMPKHICQIKRQIAQKTLAKDLNGWYCKGSTQC